MTTTQAQKESLGRHGENVAVAHLEQAGLTVLVRNWWCPHGEIDVVALDGRTLVVCEVKTRRGGAHGSPFEAVTPQKAARLRRLTAAWMEAHPAHADVADGVRIDVVGVLVPSRGAAQVERIQGVS